MPVDYKKLAEQYKTRKSGVKTATTTTRAPEMQEGEDYTAYEAPKKSGGFFSTLARGAAKTPLKFLGTAHTAVSAAGQLLTGQKEKAAETIAKGSDKMRKMEKDLGYEEGDISKPYMIANDVEIETDENGKKKMTGGEFGKNTVDVFGAGAELASYGMGAPQAKGAWNLAKGGKSLVKIGFNTAKKEAVAGAVGQAGAKMQEEDATVGDVLTEGAKGAGLGFAGGFATPFISKGYQGLKNWSKAADEAVEAARKADMKVDKAAHWTKQKPLDEAEQSLKQPLNDIDDDLFPPKAPSAVPLSEQMAKKAKKAGFSEVHTGIISDMPIEQRKVALEMQEAAEEKMRHFDTAPHPMEKVSKPFVDKFSQVNKIKSEAGASLDGLVDKMPKQAIPLQEPTDALHGWLDSKKIKIKQLKDGELALDFDASVFRGSSASKDRAIIEEVFRELHPERAGAQTIHRTPEEIRTLRQYLKKTTDDNKTSSVKMFSDQVNPMIEGIRKRLNEPLEKLSPEYAAANKKYAIASNALNDFKKFLGKDFADATDEEVLMKMNEIMPRLAGNAPAKVSMAINNFMDAAESLGIARTDLDDPRALIHVSAMLDDLYGLTNPNSPKGNFERAGENVVGKTGAVVDIAKNPLNPINVAEGAYKLFGGDATLKRRRLLKQMLGEGIGLSPKADVAKTT